MGTMWSKQQTVAEKSAISPSGSPARLGSSLQIKGEITGSEDLQIDGVVEGPISLDGHDLIVGSSAHQIVTVDDKRYEDKNRAANQPMIFYRPGTHQAEELVINKIGGNSVSGYLSISKATSIPASSQSNQ